MKLRQKLKSQMGFTLAETLLAVLILLLVSTIVANGIPAATKAYQKTVLAANAQSLMSTTVAALRDELGTAWDVTVVGNEITYYSADTGNRTTLKKDGTGAIIITEYISTDGLNVNATSTGNERQLTPKETLTQDLTITYDTVTDQSTDDSKVVVFKGLKVTPKGDSEQVIAQMESLTIRVITAKPIPASST